jgi:transposase
MAHQVYSLGLSFDKAIPLQKFFQNLDLKKSQVDAMLHQLSRVWEKEFESLLKLLTNSIVVHADETSWGIKSVWAFLSENSRVVLFGVNKDAKTLALELDPASYKGTVVSDNAAVYGRFSNTQKCWAHLLRKEIKLTLLDPKNKEYIDFADGAFQIFYDGRSLQKNQSISEAERTLRDPATARRVGRTNKTLRGARRQTIIHSVFESIRTQIQTFTLQGVLDEISS